MKAGFLSWQEEGGKVAVHHLEFANKLNTDVVKPLEAFVKAKEPERKKVFIILCLLIDEIYSSFSLVNNKLFLGSG